MNTSDAFDIALQFLGRGTQLEDFFGDSMNVNAGDVYQFMSPSFGPYEDHVTNGPFNLSLSMFEVKDFLEDSNVTLNINQMMSPRFGEDILGLPEDQDQDQRTRIRGPEPEYHVTNGSAHSALSMFVWYTVDIILQLFQRGVKLEDSMNVNASDANGFISPRFEEYENHICNCSIHLLLSMFIWFNLIIGKLILFLKL